MDVRSEDRVMIQKHWKDTAVFTDALYIEPWEWGEIGKKVQEGELLPGELSAVTFPAGCYTVRSAQRVYRIYGTGYFPEKETPVSREETERVRKDVTPMGTIGPWFLRGVMNCVSLMKYPQGTTMPRKGSLLISAVPPRPAADGGRSISARSIPSKNLSLSLMSTLPCWYV